MNKYITLLEDAYLFMYAEYKKDSSPTNAKILKNICFALLEKYITM